MSKYIAVNSPSSTVRIVIKLHTSTAERVRKIPPRKRSKFIEEAVLKKIADENKEYAWQHMLAVRNSIKIPIAMSEIVEDLRKDRRSH